MKIKNKKNNKYYLDVFFISSLFYTTLSSFIIKFSLY